MDKDDLIKFVEDSSELEKYSKGVNKELIGIEVAMQLKRIVNGQDKQNKLLNMIYVELHNKNKGDEE